MRNRFTLFSITPILLLMLAGCKRNAQSAIPKPPPGIDYSIDVPNSQLGVSLDNVPNILTLNLYVVPNQEDPKVLLDLNDRKNVELHLTDTSSGKMTRPLHEALLQFRKEHPGDCQVIINAPAQMKYAQIQLILIECAVAGITRPNFATKGSTESKSGRHFLPCVLPVTKTMTHVEENKERGLPEKELEVSITSPSDNESVIRISNLPEFKNGVDPSGRTLARALEGKRNAIEEEGERADNFTLLLAPKFSTRYDHIIAAYEASMLAKWPHIGFRSATE